MRPGRQWRWWHYAGSSLAVGLVCALVFAGLFVVGMMALFWTAMSSYGSNK